MKIRVGQRGQTSVEYLLLLGLVTVLAYITSTVGLAPFTRRMLQELRFALGNVVQNGSLQRGPVSVPGSSGHPGDPQRHKRLH